MKKRGGKRKQVERPQIGRGRTEGIRAMITPELLGKLRARAAKEHRTLSTMIELMLERGVDKE
jgi:hypothetical protein